MMKKPKTLADISGLGALRLAREGKSTLSEPELARSDDERAAPAEQRAQIVATALAPKAPKAQDSMSAIQQPRPVGRPKTGKRSSADYRNVTVYIRKDTHADVDEILRRRRRTGRIAEGEPHDVSDLVQDLLAAWLANQPQR